MKVTTREIMDIVSVLCQHLDNCGCSEVEIEETSYWSIPKEYEYDAYSDPREHTLGDLQDDWDQLQRMAMNPDDAVGYGLVWLASVLRAVGQQTAS
ncbi:hypothetical protein LCGC14_2494630 [marine sediment metagenome]|uniref:Uncharacterized protein n=1 Tax=marine sediment metagenome TaxID=412755 RepID=A0A0F9BRN2_9ZZZZ